MIFPSQARKESMALAFAELNKVANPVICEVGRMRNPNAGESDGHSTLSFLDYVNERKGRLDSVDVDRETNDLVLSIIKQKGINSDRLTLLTLDVLDYFLLTERELVPPMDLLYLDAWDLVDTVFSAKRHASCFLLAESFVKPGGLVLIDDTGYPDLGKGKLVIPVAKLMGWTVLHQGFQTLLRKP